jgi:RNAse (barnase) inhibitor barstar
MEESRSTDRPIACWADMNIKKATFPFPPGSHGEWRGLDETGRRQWLDCAHHCVFCDPSEVVHSKSPGRVVVLEGAIIDDLLGFYCAIGEAVNGPGGYFGRSMQGFDDCLFGDFGLEYPYTIVWKESDRSKRSLGSQALLRFLAEECGHALSAECSEGGQGLVSGDQGSRPSWRANLVRRNCRGHSECQVTWRWGSNPCSGVVQTWV